MRMHKLGEYIFFIAIAFFVALLFFVSAPLQDALLDVVVLFGSYVADHPILGTLIFIALAAVSAFLSPFSSAPLVPVAVLIWGNTLTSGMLFLGWMIGDVIAYGIGAYAGKPIMRYLIAEEKVAYYRARIPQRAEFPLILLFRYAVPSEVGGYVLGAVRAHFWKYFIATFLAELPFALMTVYASDALVRHEPLLFIAWAISIIAIIGVMFYFFHRYIKKNH
ncbi:hypothetical protein A2Z10_01525 [Candidatus Azambacteria bacterium RBG_16_47_10]|uniref:TVP38/TMEM64 family membrane protein n=1 Tax=Candidatus Azambacteria bacterium RBG_16_47_10 TaxID=1797292 RepID=A0A1F5AZK6_9BACT|nr:MAG: hypothetical protein A2Z10_01525 [Candidatus Azambacteria bacterium RBG_16_47_10]